MEKQTEMIEVPITKVFINKNQPREEFDKEALDNLKESIVSNGLINPITTRVIPNGYEVVAGERRLRACKAAGMKKVQIIVKEYDNDIDWKVQSLIENTQREDLTSSERENNIYELWATGNFKAHSELAKKLGISYSSVKSLIEAKEVRDNSGTSVSSRVIADTAPLELEDRKKIFKGVEEGKIFPQKVREVTRVLKVAPKDVKEAFFNEEITAEQAQAVSKLKDVKQREKAIREHKNISEISQAVERNVEKSDTAKDKREQAKKLAQAKVWISGFRSSVTETNSNLEKTIKRLLVASKFVPVMDDKEKEILDSQLDRFLETLNRGTQLAERIQEMIE